VDQERRKKLRQIFCTTPWRMPTFDVGDAVLRPAFEEKKQQCIAPSKGYSC
jgi:hypothetical protein